MKFLSALVAAFFLAIALAVAGPRAMAAADSLTIATISSRADMVSGGDALVEIRGASGDAAVVKVNDRNVSAVFHTDADRKSLVGLVDGLKAGKNVITAKAGSQSARLELTNYPITGPIFSGDHLTPFLCNTMQSGLGEPLDAECSARTKVEYFYKSSTPPGPPAAGAGRGRGAAPAFKPFDPSMHPADIAETTTSTGAKVPYIVRVESGTINRAIYRIAILDDPARGRR